MLMNMRAEVLAPRLAAFGPPIWAYKPVSILGVQIAGAVVAGFVGLVFLALPVVVAFMVGGQLDSAHAATVKHSPSAYTVTVESPSVLPAAYTLTP